MASHLALRPLYVTALSIALLGGCAPLPRPDVAGDAARATGIHDAIVMTQEGEAPLDAAPAAGATLTLQQAVRLAITRDPRIQAALAKVRVAQAEARQARLLPNPILNLSWRFPEGGGPAIFETMLSGDLVAVLEKPGQISAADSRLRAAASDALTTVLDVLNELQQTYVAAQSADAELGTLEKRATVVKRLRDIADVRLQAGAGTRLDVLTFDAQRINLAVELSQRRQQRTEHRLALARLIGEPSSAADWQLSPWHAPAPIRAGEAAWIHAALMHRPEIRSHAWELAALGDEVSLAALAPLEGGDIGPHGERDASWVVGPDLTTPVPIFDFGQQHKAHAEALRQQARHELLQLRREVVEEVRQAYASYESSRTAMELAQGQLIPVQEKRLDQAEQAYRSGEADLATLLLAETDLQDSRVRLMELEELVTVAMLKLQRAVGGAGIGAAVESAPATMPATRPAAVP